MKKNTIHEEVVIESCQSSVGWERGGGVKEGVKKNNSPEQQRRQRGKLKTW